MFSADGRAIAYVSNETGRNEIYIRPFPGPGEQLTVSTEGGNEPFWASNGRVLFYRNGDSMMAVDVTLGSTLKAPTQINVAINWFDELRRATAAK